MILLTESEEDIRSLPDHHALSDRIMGENNEKPQWKWHMKGVWATNFICHLIFGGHLLNIPKVLTEISVSTLGFSVSRTVKP